MVKNY
jgi:hypothetical protein